jgi:transcriptional regulator with XRE-family HTH domain
MSTIGDRLYSVRQQKDVSRAQLALRIGLRESDVRDIENGKTIPDLGTLERLAGAMEIPLVKLFYDGDKSPDFVNLPDRITADEIAGTAPMRLSKKSRAQPF